MFGRRTRSRQPQGHLTLRSEFVNACAFAWLPGGVELMSGLAPILQNAGYYGGSINGRALVCTYGAFVHNGALFPDGILVDANFDQLATFLVVIDGWQQSDGGSLPQLLGATTGGGGGIGINSAGNVTSNPGAHVSAAALTTNTPYVLATEHSYGNQATFWINGARETVADGGFGGSQYMTIVGGYAGNQSIGTSVLAAFAWNRGFEDGWHRDVAKNPWLLFRPRVRRTYFLPSGAAVQYAYPIADIAAGGWLPSSGSDLYAMVDEVTPDDADYDYTLLPGQTAKLQLTSITDPASSTGHKYRFRAYSAQSRTVQIEIYSGATLVKTTTQLLTPTVAQYEITLSGAEADLIGNYADLEAWLTGVAP